MTTPHLPSSASAPGPPSAPAAPPPRLTAEDARALLRLVPAEIAPGLGEAELDAVEERFGFRFAADHRVFLAAGLPLGSPRWPDWRGGDPDDLADRLARPADGLLFDVEHNGFWHPAWGPRPSRVAEALRLARAELANVPPLVPLYSHRYLPGTSGDWGHPVLSVVQTDIIVYGNDLADYLRHEFTGRASSAPPGRRSTSGRTSSAAVPASTSPPPPRTPPTPTPRGRPSSASGCWPSSGSSDAGPRRSS
ncbi:SMI1/KNR4 family protein [Streptomyces sp. NPDC056056]|uniref:hypothetical protein n=1 Tax=Streptomyces sp. NPDC056056 TaxID=3345698 RepID=UPI0035D7F941